MLAPPSRYTELSSHIIFPPRPHLRSALPRTCRRQHAEFTPSVALVTGSCLLAGAARSDGGQGRGPVEMASAPTGLNPPGTGDPLRRMHVARPKSAKGRTRTTPQGFSHHADVYPCHTSPTPRPPSARAPSGPRIGQEDIPELLNQLPCRPPSSSLNRYRVLPSIATAESSGERGEDKLVRQTGSMKLVSESGGRPPAKALYRSQPSSAASDGHLSGSHRCSQITDSSVTVNLQEPSEEEPRLLLAIRTPSGQRFQRHFRPTDSLFTVLAVAEEKTGVPCNDCIVESMEVPRRSFVELNRNLQECNIPNKSVLCIQYRERD